MTDVNPSKSEAKNEKNNGKSNAPDTGAAVSTSTVEHWNPYDLIIIGIDTKDDDEHALYDERNNIPLDDAEILGYGNFGVRKAIVALRSQDRKPVVVDGRQRVRYARAVYDLQTQKGTPTDKRITVPVTFTKGVSTPSQLWDLSRQLNVHHRSGGMMMAREVAKTLKLNGGDYKRAAISYSKAEQWVRDMENVANKLAPEVQAKIMAKELTMTAAIELTGLTHAQQKEVLGEIEDDGDEPDVGKVKQKAAAKKGKTGQSVKDKMDRIEIALRKFAGLADSQKTREYSIEILNYCAKQATGKDLAKLAAEKAGEKKPAKAKK